MKQGIHPNYHKVKCICTSCGAEFETGSTIKGDELRVDTCSNCHPFFTGRQRFAAAQGRIEKFNKKYGLKQEYNDSVRNGTVFYFGYKKNAIKN